eukprot:15843773-Heterocapsa_arctica.AAC.1
MPDWENKPCPVRGPRVLRDSGDAGPNPRPASAVPPPNREKYSAMAQHRRGEISLSQPRVAHSPDREAIVAYARQTW